MAREIDVYCPSCVTVVLKKWRKQIKKIKGIKNGNTHSVYVKTKWRWKGVGVMEGGAT